jgi:hypothetical protein
MVGSLSTADPAEALERAAMFVKTARRLIRLSGEAEASALSGE